MTYQTSGPLSSIGRDGESDLLNCCDDDYLSS